MYYEYMLTCFTSSYWALEPHSAHTSKDLSIVPQNEGVWVEHMP